MILQNSWSANRLSAWLSEFSRSMLLRVKSAAVSHLSCNANAIEAESVLANLRVLKV